MIAVKHQELSLARENVFSLFWMLPLAPLVSLLEIMLSILFVPPVASYTFMMKLRALQVS